MIRVDICIFFESFKYHLVGKREEIILLYLIGVASMAKGYNIKPYTFTTSPHPSISFN